MKDPTRRWNWREFTGMEEWSEMIGSLSEMRAKEQSQALASMEKGELNEIRYYKGRLDGVDAVLSMLQRLREQSRNRSE